MQTCTKLLKFKMYIYIYIFFYFFSWAANQHIRMISEGSYDTEDWRSGCWKFSFAVTEVNYILKYITTENLF